ncbi:MAG: DnaA/Hda family protein [Candidatus Hydrothermales bacterium]
MSLLNPRFTFKNFIEYKGNKMAKRALETIVEEPLLFNPIFIYSEPGMGKTHLVTALAHKLREKNIKELFLTPREFEKDYEKIYEFKKGFLIIDNFETFHKIKNEIIEDFSKNIDIILANEIQIILSSSLMFDEIKGLKEELISRIKGGLVIEILPPDEEDIKLLVKEKLSKRGALIEERFINLISKKGYKNIREIEGDINKLFLRFISKEKIEEEDIEEITGISLSVLFFSDIIPDIEKSLEKLEIIAREEEAIKTALKEKIYIWEMKGYKTDRLKKLIDIKDIEIIKKEYKKFISDITKLIEFQKIYGEIGEQDLEIERALFDPERIEEVEKFIEEKRAYLKTKEIPKKLRETEYKIIESDYNREVLENIRKQVTQGDPPLIFVFSPGHRGLSTHLLYAYEINPEPKKRFFNSGDLADLFFENESKLNTVFEDFNFIIIDDAEIFFDVEDLRDKLIPLIIKEKIKGKKFLIGIKKEMKEIYLPPEFKNLFNISKVTFIEKPDNKIFLEILNQKLKSKNIEIDENLKKEIINRDFFDLKEFEEYLDEFFKEIEKVKTIESSTEFLTDSGKELISLDYTSLEESKKITFDIEILEERIFEDYP